MTPFARRLGFVLIAALTGCKGNVNDESFLIATTIRISVSTTGGDPLGMSSAAVFSADGLFIAFESVAANLVPGDSNGTADIFVYDVAARTTQRVSVDSLEVEAAGDSRVPSISADGNLVLFESAAQLDTADTDFSIDVYVRDRSLGTTTMVSLDAVDGEIMTTCDESSMSADGQVIAFSSTATVNTVMGPPFTDSNTGRDVFVRAGGTTVLVSQAFGATASGSETAQRPSVSGDGQFIAFSSASTNLIDSVGLGITDTNIAADVFVFDRLAPAATAMTPISVRADGTAMGNGSSERPAMSQDGSIVAFHSNASNLLPAGADLNGAQDVFVRAGTVTTLVSRNSAGIQGSGASQDARISPDGRFVVFYSLAENLSDGDDNGTYDTYLRDRVTGITDRVSTRTFGGSSNGVSTLGSASVDGRFVAFESDASNLDDNDHNGLYDIFLRGPLR